MNSWPKLRSISKLDQLAETIIKSAFLLSEDQNVVTSYVDHTIFLLKMEYLHTMCWEKFLHWSIQLCSIPVLRFGSIHYPSWQPEQKFSTKLLKAISLTYKLIETFYLELKGNFPD
jgi:hypothetical protein